MAKTFNTIIEENMRRYQQNTLIVGDRVKFIDNFFNHEWTKTQPVLKIERLKALIEGGQNIRITAVKTDRPNTAESGHFEIVDGVYYDIVEEIAPGRYGHLFTVPCNVVEHLDDYPNLAGETPSQQVKDDPTHIEPSEVSIDSNELGPRHQTHCEHPPKDNPTGNTTLDHAQEPTPGDSYTKKYLEG